MAGLLAAITGVDVLSTPTPAAAWNGIANFETYIQHAGLTANTKLYALPNSHLILAFYTGLPFQSIYAVRKTFLDAYPGEIVYVDLDDFGSENRNRHLAPGPVREAAVRAGAALDEAGAEVLSRRLRTLQYRQSMSRRIGGVPASCAESVPGYTEQLLKRQSVSDAAELSTTLPKTPILRGFQIRDWHEWIGVLIYRFADPACRLGPALNYADRLRGTRADILSGAGWIIYRSPQDRDRRAGVTFRLLE